jgi:hypothetical protein
MRRTVLLLVLCSGRADGGDAALLPYCAPLGDVEAQKIEPLPEAFRTGMLKLLQLQVLIRHGARAPWANHRCWAGSEAGWNCKMTNLMRPDAARDDVLTTQPPVRRLFRKLYAHGGNDLGGDCQVGQLLQLGFDQQRANGRSLAAAYVGKGKLFAAADLRTLPSTQRDFFLARSDDMQRTVMSGQALFDAMFAERRYAAGNPGSARHRDAWVVPWHVRDRDRDTLAPNAARCPRLALARWSALRSPAHAALRGSAAIADLTRRVAAVFGPRFDWGRRGWERDGSAVTDCLLTAHCNGRALPAGVDTRTLKEALAWDERVHETIYRHNASYYAKLAMRPLFRELWREIEVAVRPDEAAAERRRLVLYSGHDDTLMPLLAALGGSVWDGRWSPYAAVLLIETYQLYVPSAASASGWKHAVRLLYRGKPLVLPGCQTSVCDVDVLRAFVKSLDAVGGCELTAAERLMMGQQQQQQQQQGQQQQGQHQGSGARGAARPAAAQGTARAGVSFATLAASTAAALVLGASLGSARARSARFQPVQLVDADAPDAGVALPAMQGARGYQYAFETAGDGEATARANQI